MGASVSRCRSLRCAPLSGGACAPPRGVGRRMFPPPSAVSRRARGGFMNGGLASPPSPLGMMTNKCSRKARIYVVLVVPPSGENRRFSADFVRLMIIRRSSRVVPRCGRLGRACSVPVSARGRAGLERRRAAGSETGAGTLRPLSVRGGEYFNSVPPEAALFAKIPPGKCAGGNARPPEAAASKEG